MSVSAWYTVGRLGGTFQKRNVGKKKQGLKERERRKERRKEKLRRKKWKKNRRTKEGNTKEIKGRGKQKERKRKKRRVVNKGRKEKERLGSEGKKERKLFLESWNWIDNTNVRPVNCFSTKSARIVGFVHRLMSLCPLSIESGVLFF
jgi:hypothetical protein